MPKDPQDAGVSMTLDHFITDEVTGLEEYEFAEKVKATLEKMGLSGESLSQPVLEDEHAGILPHLSPGDYFDGRMPSVLKRLSLDQLSALSGLMNNWHQYVVAKRSLAAVEKSEAARRLKFITSLVRRQYKDTGNASSDDEAKEKANQDFRVVNADSIHSRADLVYRALDDQVSLAKTNMATLSRELSNVKTKLEQDGIGGGYPGRPQHGFRNWRNERDEEEETPQPPPKPVRPSTPYKRPKVKRG